MLLGVSMVATVEEQGEREEELMGHMVELDGCRRLASGSGEDGWMLFVERPGVQVIGGG